MWIVKKTVEGLFPFVLSEHICEAVLFLVFTVDETIFVPLGAGQAGLKLAGRGEAMLGWGGAETGVLIAELADEVTL